MRREFDTKQNIIRQSDNFTLKFFSGGLLIIAIFTLIIGSL